MARRRVLADADLLRSAPKPLGSRVEPLGPRAGSQPDRRPQPQCIKVGNVQGPAAPLLRLALRTGRRDMAERVRPGVRQIAVEEPVRIRRSAAADTVHHHQKGARHQPILSWIRSGGDRLGASDRVKAARSMPRHGARGLLAGRMDAQKRRSAVDLLPDPGDVAEPHGKVEPVVLLQPPAAQLHHRLAQRAGVDGVTYPASSAWISTMIFAAGSRSRHRSTKSDGPPSSATISPNVPRRPARFRRRAASAPRHRRHRRPSRPAPAPHRPAPA
jgi:hypothetical protein